MKQKIANRIFSLLLTKNYLSKQTHLELKKDVNIFGNKFDGNIKIDEFATLKRCELFGDVSVGAYSSLNGPNLDIYAGQGRVEIGKFCSIARNVSIQVEGHNHKKITTYLIYKNVFQEENESEIVNSGKLIIGNDVWIGSHSVIYGNINIGTGSVIAANSFVNSDVPPYSIVAGSPAKVVKYRFDQILIKELLKLEWWNWDKEQLKKNKFLFQDTLTLDMLKKNKILSGAV